MQTASSVFASREWAIRLVVAASLVLSPLSIRAGAQEAAQDTTTPVLRMAPVVPQQVRYSGKIAARAGDTVEVVFRIYAAAEDSDPLWAETQRVPVGEDGAFSVLLGGASPSGLPQTVFAGGAARWLGVTLERGPEQERVLLSSVPYAMKSADAESLAGHAATDFVTQDQLAQFARLTLSSTPSAAAGSASPAITPLTSEPVTGSGTAGTVPVWTGTLTQGNSEITQVGSEIGINEPTPGATLDVGGTSMFRGTATLTAEATATASAGYRSQLLDFSDSAWSTTTKAPVTQTWRLYVTDSANNSPNPTSSFNFQFQNGVGSPTPTILSIAQTGVISFAPAQTFPGTIASVTGTSPVTATTTSGAVSVGLDTNALESTLNSVYAQLGSANAFAGEVLARQATGVGYAALVGTGTNGSMGAYGQSDSGYGAEGVSATGSGVYGTSGTGSGVYGTSSGTGAGGYFINNTTYSPALYAENDATGGSGYSIGLRAYVPNVASIGVIGEADGADSYALYGENQGGKDSYAVFGTASGLGSTAIYGISTGGADSDDVIGSGVVGASSKGIGVNGVSGSSSGVVGSSEGSSTMGKAIGSGSMWGVWGDSAVSTSGFGGGVLGTTDNGYAGYFANNSSIDSTLFASNQGNYTAASVSNSSPKYPALDVSNGGGYSGAGIANKSDTWPTLYLVNAGTAGFGTDVRTKTAEAGTNALFKTLIASTPTGTCGIGGDGDLSCTGQVKSLVSTGGGTRKVETYAMESPENWMEDFGAGELQQGVAVVRIDPVFSETVSEAAGYHVFITPKGDSKGLYVINETAISFEVRESGVGTSSLAFDYRIVAKRRGYETQRLTDVTERFNAESKVIMPGKPSGTPQDAEPQPVTPKGLNTPGIPHASKGIYPVLPTGALPPTRTAQP